MAENETAMTAGQDTDTAGGQKQTKKEPEQETPKKPEKKARVSPMRYPQLFILHSIIVVIMIWLLFGVFFGLMTAPNNDMYPRIDNGDLLLYYRMEKAPKAQDVVVIRKNNTTYVGRVVAAAGDTVEITDDEKLKINGHTMIEKNIYQKTPRYEGFNQYPLTLAEGAFFVLADARSNAEDSRYYGPVSADEIQGTVITVVRRNNL